MAELETWMREERAKLAKHAPVAKAFDYRLKRIAEHPVQRIDELLPWNWKTEKMKKAA